MKSTSQLTTLLRRSLKGNACFSFLSGLVFVMAHQPLARFIGIDQPMLILLIGVALLIFAAALFHNALRQEISRLEARIAVVLDLAWVAGSALILPLGLLTSGGNWLVIIIADVVLAFAILQHLGLRRMTRPRSPLPS